MKGVILWVLLTAGVMAGIFLFPRVLTWTLKAEPAAAVVISRSMWPVLNRGDIVFVKATTREEIKVGTILVFKHGEGIAIHRVVRLSGDTIVTKGDANSKEDDPITFDDVVGRLPSVAGHYAKVPWAGKIPLLVGSNDSDPLVEDPSAEKSMFGSFGKLIRNPFGLMLLVVFPGALLLTVVAMEVVPRVGPGRKRRRWRQRRLQRLGKRWARSRLAYR